MTARSALARVAVAVALLAGCDDDAGPFVGDPDYERDPALDVAVVSANGEARSHAVGENCMACHQANGPGPGLFTAAGTIYDADGAPHVDGALELRDGAGALVLRVEADGLGNFYTTEPLPLPDTPLFPVVFSSDGARSRAMPFPTNSAACNVCHVGGMVIALAEG